MKVTAWMVLISVGLVGCGASDKRAEAPVRGNDGTVPISATSDAAPHEASKSTESSPSQQSVRMGNGGTPVDDAPQGIREARVKARAEFSTASDAFQLGATDCGTACKALGSMERATAKLCQLVLNDADQSECDERKESVRRARDRIRATCGKCPGGPSLEHAARIPSI